MGLVHVVQRLAAAPVRRFADWPPDDTLAKGGPGVFAIFARDDFLHVGLSWKDRKDTCNPQAQGVWGRLQTLMIRNPTSALMTEIFERYVRPTLNPAEQARLAADPLLAKAAAYRMLRREFGYRAIVTADGAEAQAVAEAVRHGNWPFGQPIVKPSGLPATQTTIRRAYSPTAPLPSVPTPVTVASTRESRWGAIVDQLAEAPLRRFADWPDDALPKGQPGVYAIWCDDDLVYAGCAFRDRAHTTNPQAQGVWGRLQTHARGTQPSQLSDGVFRYYVLRTLTEEQRTSEAFIPRVASRDFLRERLAYRAVVTESGEIARAAEDEIRRGRTRLGPPLFNSK